MNTCTDCNELVYYCRCGGVSDKREKQQIWFPMRTAPKDGTVIQVLSIHRDFSYPMFWLEATDKRGSGIKGWHLAWDGTYFSEDELTYWMPCPDIPNSESKSHSKDLTHILPLGDTTTPIGRLATLLVYSLGIKHPAINDLASVALVYFNKINARTKHEPV